LSGAGDGAEKKTGEDEKGRCTHSWTMQYRGVRKQEKRFRFQCARLILEKAVGTTDFTDFTDEEDVALERALTRRASAEKAPSLRESGSHPCDLCHPWFLNCLI
jgi:hypothetical protein